jgi:integrase/recombinase XerD
MPTLKDALTDFLRVERSPQTTRHYRRFLAPFVAAIGPARDLRRVTFDDISDYFAAYRPRVRPSTLCQYANVCKSFFSFCARQRWLEESPAADLHFRDPGRAPGSRAIPAADLDRMLAFARPHLRNYAVLLFLIDTGCRVGGLCSLTLDTLYLDEGRAVLLEKGSKWHTAYFGAETAEALRAWLAKRPAVDHRHVWTTTGRMGEALKPTGVSEMIRKLAERSGASRAWGPHAIRHSVGEAYADAGVPPTVLQHKLGHSSPHTTLDHYYPHDQDRVRDTSHRMPLAPLARATTQPRKPAGKILDIRHFGN